MPNKRLLIFFCFTIAFIWDVKAHSDVHYGKAEAIASGNGRVYVSTSNTPPAYNQMQSSHSQSFDCGKDADKDEKTYQYHAQSSDASKYDFIGWSETVGGEIMNSSTPFSVKVKATSKNKNNPTTVTRYAHFVPFFKYTADACWSVGGTASTSWTSKKVQGAEGETQNSTKVIFTAIPNEGYDFKGWASTNDAESYVATENPYEATVTNTSIGSTVDKTLCAIFAKFRIINPNTEPFISPSPLTINFGDVAYSATASYTKTFAIDAHNVGIWSNLSGLSGVFSATKSGYSNDDSQQTCTITVTLNPNELGEKNQTLHIETSRGGTIDVIVSAIISGTPTYTWNPVIWNTDGSQKATVYVDDPVLTNIVSSTSNGAWTYSITGTPSGVNNEGATAPTFTSNQVTCGQAGVYTLFVRQAAEVGGYKAGSDSRTLTINKRNNVIKVEGSPAYSTSMYYASTQGVVITSDNDGGSAPAFAVSASSNAAVATYSGTGAGGTITTYFTDAEAFSKLPGRLDLISMLMATMKAPVQKLAATLLAYHDKLESSQQN